MGEPPAKRAFYKSPVFRLALVYLAGCAFAVVWSEAHLAWHFRDAWLSWRPPLPPLPPGDWRDWGPHESEMADAYVMVTARPPYCRDLLIQGYSAALIAVPFAAALGALARLVARARVRAGLADPLARIRTFATRHPVLTAAPPAMMGLAYEATSQFYRYSGFFSLATARAPRLAYEMMSRHVDLFGFAIAAAPLFLVHLLLTRLALPALLAPTLEGRSETAKETVAEHFEFAAVALTREARFAVKGLAGLTIAMVAALIAVPTFDNLAIDISVALYVPVTVLSALYFRRASRISVGLDGIHVRGSSRSRFYAFHELDDVRTNGATIELVRGGRAVLRLQLHGPDAARRDALAQRLAAAVARASEERDQPVTRFVNGATGVDLARAAEGGGNYRSAAVSREQLWAAVEGPAVASGARIAAAKALATSADASERARFRVAVDHCAEPSVRAQLQDVLDENDDDDAPAARRLTILAR